MRLFLSPSAERYRRMKGIPMPGESPDALADERSAPVTLAAPNGWSPERVWATPAPTLREELHRGGAHLRAYVNEHEPANPRKLGGRSTVLSATTTPEKE
jgi:hypothetical protein